MDTPASPRTRAITVVTVTLLAHLVLVGLALERAAGAVLVDPATSSYETEFIHAGFWSTAFLLVPLLGVAAVLWWPVAVLGAALTVGIHTVAAAVTVHRYQESGWSDGLEVFSYAWPLGHAAFGGAAVLIGAAITAGRRRARDRGQGRRRGRGRGTPAAPGAAGRR